MVVRTPHFGGAFIAFSSSAALFFGEVQNDSEISSECLSLPGLLESQWGFWGLCEDEYEQRNFMGTSMKESERAFEWITGLLDELGYPYLVVGGLAATIFGSKRTLYDIDLDVPAVALEDIARRFKGHVTFGPARFRDEQFDIQLLSLRYADQDIDLTAAEDIQLFDRTAAQWRHVPTDLMAREIHEVLGKKVFVMKRDALIAYKKMLARDTDLEDVAAMVG